MSGSQQDPDIMCEVFIPDECPQCHLRHPIDSVTWRAARLASNRAVRRVDTAHDGCGVAVGRPAERSGATT